MPFYMWQTDAVPSKYQTDNPVTTWRWPVVKLSVQCAAAAAVAGMLAPATCHLPGRDRYFTEFQYGYSHEIKSYYNYL